MNLASRARRLRLSACCCILASPAFSILTTQNAAADTTCTLPSTGDAGAYINDNCFGVPGTVTLSAGTYTLRSPILVPSNITLTGATGAAGTTTLNGLVINGAGTNYGLIGMQGVANVTVQNLTLSNGKAAAIATLQTAVYADYCTHCTFTNLTVSSVGRNGIVVKHCSDCYITYNTVNSFAYAGIIALYGGDHIYIRHNTVVGPPTNTTEASPGVVLGYGIIASGYSELPPIANYNNYVWVEDNVVGSVPRWECFDTHGGDHQYFTRNTCKEGKIGLGAGLEPSGALTPSGTDLEVRSNIFTSSVYSAANSSYGNGSCMAIGSGSVVIPLDAVIVDSNTCSGFGSGSTAPNDWEAGLVSSQNTKNFAYTNNICNNYCQSCFALRSENQQGTISGNKSYDMASDPVVAGARCASGNGNAAGGIYSSQIFFKSVGNYGVSISGNSLTPSSKQHSPCLQVYQEYEQNNASLVLSNTTSNFPGPVTGTPRPCYALPSNQYYNSPKTLPMNMTDHQSTLLIGQIGDIFYKADGTAYGTVIPDPKITPTQIGYAAVDLGTVATGKVIAGQNTITSIVGQGQPYMGCSGNYWYYCFPINMNIVVKGAGVGGEPLNARIIGLSSSTGNLYLPDTILLNVPAITTVNGSSRVDITWAPITVLRN